MDVITYPCWDKIEFMILVKRATRIFLEAAHVEIQTHFMWYCLWYIQMKISCQLKTRFPRLPLVSHRRTQLSSPQPRCGSPVHKSSAWGIPFEYRPAWKTHWFVIACEKQLSWSLISISFYRVQLLIEPWSPWSNSIASMKPVFA